jgi:hypothetical protein
MLRPPNSSGLYLWVGNTPQEGTVFLGSKDMPGGMSVRDSVNYFRSQGKKVTLVHPLIPIPSTPIEEEDGDQS